MPLNSGNTATVSSVFDFGSSAVCRDCVQVGDCIVYAIHSSRDVQGTGHSVSETFELWRTDLQGNGLTRITSMPMPKNAGNDGIFGGSLHDLAATPDDRSVSVKWDHDLLIFKVR